MKRILLVIGIFIVLSSMSVGCAEPAPVPEKPAEVIEWRFHTNHTEGRIELVQEQDWCDMVNEATDGRLKITVYPGRALGFKDADMLRICGGGTVEAFMSYPGYLVRDEPALGIIAPMFVFRTRAEFVELLHYANELYAELFAEHNIRLMTQAPSPQCYVSLVSNSPMNTLEKMQGKKIRSWDFVQNAALNDLGVASEIFPGPDAYLGLKTGMIDGSLHSLGMVGPSSLYEVADYVCVVGLTTAPIGVAANEDAFQALPDDVKDIVLRVSKEHEDKWFELAKTCYEDEKAIKFLTEKGMNILPELPDEDKITLTDAGAKAWAAKAEESGPKSVMYQHLTMAELERIRSKSS